MQIYKKIKAKNVKQSVLDYLFSLEPFLCD